MGVVCSSSFFKLNHVIIIINHHQHLQGGDHHQCGSPYKHSSFIFDKRIVITITLLSIFFEVLTGQTTELSFVQHKWVLLLHQAMVNAMRYKRVEAFG